MLSMYFLPKVPLRRFTTFPFVFLWGIVYHRQHYATAPTVMREYDVFPTFTSFRSRLSSWRVVWSSRPRCNIHCLWLASSTKYSNAMVGVEDSKWNWSPTGIRNVFLLKALSRIWKSDDLLPNRRYERYLVSNYAHVNILCWQSEVFFGVT